MKWWTADLRLFSYTLDHRSVPAPCVSRADRTVSNVRIFPLPTSASRLKGLIECDILENGGLVAPRNAKRVFPTRLRLRENIATIKRGDNVLFRLLFGGRVLDIGVNLFVGPNIGCVRRCVGLSVGSLLLRGCITCLWKHRLYCQTPQPRGI